MAVIEGIRCEHPEMVVTERSMVTARMVKPTIIAKTVVEMVAGKSTCETAATRPAGLREDNAAAEMVSTSQAAG